MANNLTAKEKISALFSIFNELADANGIKKCQLICAGNEFLTELKNDINVMNAINSELMSKQQEVSFVSAELIDTDGEPEPISQENTAPIIEGKDA